MPLLLYLVSLAALAGAVYARALFEYVLAASASGLAVFLLAFLLPFGFYAWATAHGWRFLSRMKRSGGHLTRNRAEAGQILIVLTALPALLWAAVIEIPTASATIAEGKRLLLHKGQQQPYRIWYSKPTGRVLHVEGMITDGIADAVAYAIGRSPATRLVILESPGGSAEEGLRLAAVIKQHKLDTGVEQLCASACTLAFMGGTQRVLFPPDGRLGFHGCHDRLWFGPCNNRDFKAFLVGAGVDADFARKGWSIDPRRLWYPTADELTKAGVVTKLGTQ